MIDSIVMLISSNFTINLILVVFIGALLGEIVKEIDDDSKIIFVRFISDWIKSCFGSIILGLMLKTIHLPPLFFWGVILYTSFLGHTKSFAFLDDIFITIVAKTKELIISIIDKK